MAEAGGLSLRVDVWRDIIEGASTSPEMRFYAAWAQSRDVSAHEIARRLGKRLTDGHKDVLKTFRAPRPRSTSVRSIAKVLGAPEYSPELAARAIVLFDELRDGTLSDERFSPEFREKYGELYQKVLVDVFVLVALQFEALSVLNREISLPAARVKDLDAEGVFEIRDAMHHLLATVARSLHE